MPLYIRSEEADALARELAARTGLTITEAVTSALAEKLARTPALEKEARKQEFLAAVKRIQEASAALPVLDPREHGEMLYDEDGLPK